MATTMNSTRTRGTPRKNATQTRLDAARSNEARPRVRGSARGTRDEVDDRDAQYDLLTAALLGAAIGAGTTLLLRRGPSGDRPMLPVWRAARAGARFAGRGARFAWDRGRDAWARVPREEIEERMHDYFNSARDTIDNLMEHELKDLRRAIRRRRKRLGL
jgi:hypothetical protein